MPENECSLGKPSTDDPTGGVTLGHVDPKSVFKYLLNISNKVICNLFIQLYLNDVMMFWSLNMPWISLVN